MRMGQGVETGLGHGGITCVLQTQFSSFLFLHQLTPSHLCHFIIVLSFKMHPSWWDTTWEENKLSIKMLNCFYIYLYRYNM